MFKKQKADKHIIIAGCGRLGASMANALSEQGTSVVIIDRQKDSFLRLSASFGGIMLAGDATEIAILEEAEVEKASTVIAVTNKDNTNIMIAEMAKELFGTAQVIVRLYDSGKECVCERLDIHTICPVRLSAAEISRLIQTEVGERT